MTGPDDNRGETDSDLRTGDPLAAPATVTQEGKRIWLYPERRSGKSAQARLSLAIVLIGFYLVAPYVTVAGEPMLRLDVLAGRASILGHSFRYTDGALVFFVLALLALALFLVTALRGRVWCGWACPQTVFIDWVVRPLEELIEGDSHARRRRDLEPWTWNRFWRKTAKTALIFLLAVVVANTFLAYFIPYRTLLHWITSSPAEHPVAFTLMSLVGVLFFFDLAWFREQFCVFLCPYARFQSILVDWFSPVVGYDTKRGEPRGKPPGKGDCIDCGLCVRVCPTGIDIRRGLQLECIACERCVDACDSIMDQIDKPHGLIRVASQAELSGDTRKRFLRPRVVLYTSFLVILLSGFVFVLSRRTGVSLSLVRAPGQAFTRLAVDGATEKFSNIFQVFVENNSPTDVPLAFNIVAPTGAQLVCGGCQENLPAFESRRLNLVIVFALTQARSGERLPLLVDFPATGQRLESVLLHP